MRTEHAPTVQRAEYRPLSYTVDTVDLHFRLDAESTEVRSRMVCLRNPDAPAGPLVLYGEALELLSLTIDGREPAAEAIRRSGAVMEISVSGERLEVEVVTRINPTANTALSGLYRSRDGLFTQCEAEGFRRITWFPDRPDVMARYTVTLEGDRATYPVLLSNGNLVEEGNLPDGRHFARWEDPFPKPSYLSRWLPRRWWRSSAANGLRRGERCCCRCGSRRAIWTVPGTPWIRSSMPCVGTRRPSAWNSISIAT